MDKPIKVNRETLLGLLMMKWCKKLKLTPEQLKMQFFEWIVITNQEYSEKMRTEQYQDLWERWFKDLDSATIVNL